MCSEESFSRLLRHCIRLRSLRARHLLAEAGSRLPFALLARGSHINLSVNSGDVSQRHGKAAVRDTGQPGMRVYAINAQSAGPCRVRAEKRKLSPSHGGMLPRRASERTWQKAASTFAFPKPIRSRFSRPNFSCFCRSDVPQRETSETSKKALSGGELTN